MRQILQLKQALMIGVLLLFAYSPMLGNVAETKSKPLSEVLDQISDRYEVIITYNSNLLNEIEVDFEFANNEQFESAVNRLLVNTNLKYKQLTNKYYIVFHETSTSKNTIKKIKQKFKEIEKLQKSEDLNIQQINNEKESHFINVLNEAEDLFMEQTISGTVTDEVGEPLIGASIVAKGTSTGTVTDLQGQYQLVVADDVTILVVSYIGYATQEVEIAGRSVVDITITESTSTLDEIVVVGYASQKKVNLTGSVSTIGSAEINKVPSANITQSLAGKAPGLLSLQSQGAPGDDLTQLSIRGFDPPLVLVDGIQMDWDRIDPNEVESISILKDASAAIYGARAGNGVILITTKRGSSGKPTIEYTGNISYQNPTVLPDFVDSWQFAELLREGEFNQDLPITYSEQDVETFRNGNDPDFPNTDWHEAMFRQWAPMHSHNLSVRGGSEEVQYFVSGGYLDQASIYKSGDLNFNRYNVRSNLDAKISDNLSLSMDVAYRIELRDQPQTSLADNWGDLQLARPERQATIPDPELGAPYAGFNVRSPVAQTFQSYTGFIDDRREYITGRLGLTYKVPGIEGLEAGAYMNYLLNNTYRKTQDRPFAVLDYDFASQSYSSFGVNGQNSLNEETSKFTQFYPMVTLNYNRTFGDHSVTGLLLAEWIDGEEIFFNAGKIDLLSLDLPFLFAGSPENISATGFTVEEGRTSYAGRLNYGYKGKYLLEGTFRFDASHKFPEGSRWGFFPSVSAGWRLSEEPFLADADWLDNLKLRVSYSQAGDDDVAAFRFLQGFNIRSDIGPTLINERYIFGSTAYRLIGSTGLANPDITWLDMTTYNIGLDGEILNGLLGFEFDAFYRKVDNIFGQPLETFPSTFGAELPLLNLNSTEDKGIELRITHNNRINRDFSYSVAGMISLTREKYTDWSEPPFDDADERRIFQLTGQRTNRLVGFKTDGIFMSQAEIESETVDQDQAGNTTLRPGDIKYIDLNNDGVINFRDQDEIGYGTFPDAVFAFNFGVRYKGFSVSALFQGASQFNHQNQIHPMVNFGKPWDFHYKHRWQPDPNNRGTNINPEARLPAILGDGVGRSPHNEKVSDFWVADGTYMRLKNLNLTYSLPTNLTDKTGFQDIRVSFSGSNLLTFSNMGIFKNSIDPEAIGGGSSRFYPPVKTFAFGLNLTL